MAVIDPVLGTKLVSLLGITNVIFLLLVFFSCRCMVGAVFVNRMFRHEWYKKYFNTHCIFWWLFFISVISHAVIAILTFGFPLFQ